MALIRVCDKCRKYLEDDNGNSLNYVDIEYHRKQCDWSPLLSLEDVTLCEDCFRKIIGEKVLKELFPLKYESTGNIQLYQQKGKV